MLGRVFQVQSFCVDDGPGIRTCVYLKGCNMACPWCHNPESVAFSPQVSFIKNKCVGCGLCGAGADPAACPTGARSLVGEDRTAQDVLGQVLRDRRYFQKSGGGLTVTGGEPLVQPEFTARLLALAKAEGISTCVETNGAGRWADYEAIAPATDLFLFDYKLTDEAMHLRLTGVHRQVVLDNLRGLMRAGARAVLRCPMIPGANDQAEHLAAIAGLTRELPLEGFELMPYHDLGLGKAARFGLAPPPKYRVPDAGQVAAWRAAILDMGGREWRRTL